MTATTWLMSFRSGFIASDRASSAAFRLCLFPGSAGRMTSAAPRRGTGPLLIVWISLDTQEEHDDNLGRLAGLYRQHLPGLP